MIFHSGRPALVMRSEAKASAKLTGGVAVLAWDGSVPAARHGRRPADPAGHAPGPGPDHPQ
uniref:Uncharacterized protein n=1 Tax=Phenylobacterium glaciei TaxID=2803784 RepID=A0A974S7N3_9CAUL|nr:hypothetical protein JKL49_20750 [Phenylobacterium glaciei]